MNTVSLKKVKNALVYLIVGATYREL